ncbi:hypothetical protein [Carp edema virus]|nr:hypothetical protein [Carp edema virus]
MIQNAYKVLEKCPTTYDLGSAYYKKNLYEEKGKWEITDKVAIECADIWIRDLGVTYTFEGFKTREQILDIKLKAINAIL